MPKGMEGTYIGTEGAKREGKGAERGTIWMGRAVLEIWG